MNGQLDINTGYAKWPVALFFDYATNVEAYNSQDTAIFAGASVGALKDPGDWQFSALWGRIETESVLSVFSYSDYGRDGGTNITGPVARIDYLLLPRLTLTAKNHFVSYIDRPAGQSNLWSIAYNWTRCFHFSAAVTRRYVACSLSHRLGVNGTVSGFRESPFFLSLSTTLT